MNLYGKYVNEALVFVGAESFSRKLIGLPENMLNPTKFVDLVKRQFANFKNVEIKVLNKQELTKKQMNLMLAVGQGSNKENEPKLLSISLKNNSKAKKIVLVGKGVCFDTGGLSLKPSNYLEGMQYDMSGAAIVVGTMFTLASVKSTANVTVLAPLVINDIGSNGIKVSDVITSYSGQTVEITNTDAEGRLILADSITYAEKDLKADTIVTIATLTGAIEYALSDTFTPI
ncbi:MAG: leucyl aminopeptidase family protein [Mycoplasmoidaceae bacterium]|nr:leucyl aminopeptidase family protein [Mycoplasmoidaceae bacterium]